MAKYTQKLTADTSQHDNALKKSANQVYQYKKRVDDTKKTLSSMAANITKVAGAFGVAYGSINTFKQILTSTEKGVDALGRTMQQGKTVVNQFFASLTNGIGVQSFLSDLKEIRQTAIEAYNALDDLGTMKMWKQSRILKLQGDIAEDRGVVNDTSINANLRKEAQERISLNMAKIQALTGDMIEGTYNAYYAKINEIAGGDVGRITADWLMSSREANNGAIQKRIDELNRQYKTVKTYVTTGTSITGATTGTYQYGYSEKWAEKLVGQLERFNEATDAQIQEVLNLQNEANAMRIDVANQQRKANSATQKNVDGTAASNAPQFGSFEWLQTLSDADYKRWWDGVFQSIENEAKKQPVMIPIEVIPNEEEIETEIIELQQELQKQLVDINVAANNGWQQYEEIKSGANAVMQLYDSIANIQTLLTSDDANFSDYFFNITSAVFSTIDAITSLMEVIETINTLMKAQKTAQMVLDGIQSKVSVQEMTSKVVAHYAALGAAGIPLAASTIAAYRAMIMAGSYAQGGIIGGATTVGDNVIANVNKGEMILNQRQQTKLFDLLNGTASTANNNINGNVKFTVSGGDLVGVLNNYNNKINRVR